MVPLSSTLGERLSRSVIRADVLSEMSPVYSEPSAAHRTLLIDMRTRTSASSLVVAGSPGMTSSRADPTASAGRPFASGVAIVSALDGRDGGEQDPNASGAPCVLFGAVHELKAGTSDARNGVAPFGRAYPTA